MSCVPVQIGIADILFNIHLPDPAARSVLASRYAAFGADPGAAWASCWEITVRPISSRPGVLPLWVRHTPRRTYFRVGMQQGIIDLEARRAVLYIPDVDHLFVALERGLAYILSQDLPARRRGLLVHAAGVLLDARAHLFLGPSGAGKSTVAGLAWGRYPVLGDENLVLYREPAGGFGVYSTPCWGINTPSERVHRTRIHAQPAALYILRHAPDFALRPLSATEGALALLQSEKAAVERSAVAQAWLALAHQLLEAVPAFELSFPPRPALWDFLRSASPGGDKFV